MGKAKVEESQELIVELLRGWNFRRDVYGGITGLESLRDLGGELPSDIKTKVNAEMGEPHRAAVVEQIINGWPSI